LSHRLLIVYIHTYFMSPHLEGDSVYVFSMSNGYCTFRRASLNSSTQLRVIILIYQQAIIDKIELGLSLS